MANGDEDGDDDDDTSCRILESSLDHGQGELPHRIRSSGEREIYLQTAFDLNGRKLCWPWPQKLPLRSLILTLPCVNFRAGDKCTCMAPASALAPLEKQKRFSLTSPVAAPLLRICRKTFFPSCWSKLWFPTLSCLPCSSSQFLILKFNLKMSEKIFPIGIILHWILRFKTWLPTPSSWPCSSSPPWLGREQWQVVERLVLELWLTNPWWW